MTHDVDLNGSHPCPVPGCRGCAARPEKRTPAPSTSVASLAADLLAELGRRVPS